MIKPIKQNISFGAENAVPSVYAKVAQTTQKAPEPQVEFKVQQTKESKSTLKNIKMGIMNIAKGFNNVKDTTTGFVRGAVEGLAAGSLVGVFGYNYKANNGEFFATVGGSIKSIAGEAWKFVRNIPSIITKRSPLNTVTTILKEPFKQVKKLKGNPATIAAAIAIGLSLVAFRTIQGKVNANKKNAGIDHAMNEGHVSTK